MKLTKPNKRQQEYINKLKEIALKNPDGFTLNYKTLKPIKRNKGFLVSITQNKKARFETLAKRLIYTNNNLFKETALFIGGWKDKNLFYLDLSLYTTDENQARILSQHFKQIAYFNLETFKEIRLHSKINSQEVIN